MFMQDNLNDVEFLYPERIDLGVFTSGSLVEPFSEDTIDFLNHLSSSLYKRPDIREYPDIGTFAFFCRKSNMLLNKKRYNNDTLRLGRGIVFHITPSNVPLNFAYSFVAGLLAGNINIVRVPSARFKQIDIICETIKRIAENQFQDSIAKRIAFVRYDRRSKATDAFSSVCDVRVIWGGDNSIEEIRKSLIPARSFDLTFADRYSFCIINADFLVHHDDLEKLVTGFYNDTYLFDQNACSSPHLIIWVGEIRNIELAKEMFWSKLHNLVKDNYKVQPLVSVDKLTTFYNQVVLTGNSHLTKMPDNLIWRIKLDTLPGNIDNFRCSSGYFYEYTAGCLNELSSVINRKYQTLSYYGLTKEYLIDVFRAIKPSGIDRIVPVGKTTDFSLTWDGYDLIRTLSRECEVR